MAVSLGRGQRQAWTQQGCAVMESGEQREYVCGRDGRSSKTCTVKESRPRQRV